MYKVTTLISNKINKGYPGKTKEKFKMKNKHAGWTGMVVGNEEGERKT